MQKYLARAEKAEATVARLEGRIAELESLWRPLLNAWSGGNVQPAQMYAVIVALEKALVGDGSAIADVVAAARQLASDYLPEKNGTIQVSAESCRPLFEALSVAGLRAIEEKS